MISERKPYYRQKKWWAAAVGVLVPILNHVLGIGMDADTVTLVVVAVVGYIIGEAWTDATH
jgi:hypothetical protein